MRPFTVIDWRRDFIAALAEMIARDEDAGRTLVVFPHMRPRRYLLKALAGHPGIEKPFYPPEILSVGELTEFLYKRLAARPVAPVPALERAGLLFEVVRDALEPGPLEKLPREREKFFPWGLKLAELMEELFRQDKTPASLENLEGEVMPTAGALLEHLDRIHAAYIRALDERGWTTPGLMARFAARNASAAAGLLADRRVILAGFYALTGAENKLFKTLREQAGARVLLHGDPALAGPGKAHWSCLELTKWAEKFGARIEAGPETAEAPGEPEVRFFEAFDLHSQLKRMETELAGEAHGTRAVVLPETGSLTPVLHHLPEDAEVNISMGYALTRSPLFRLIDQALRLQENSPEPGLYYWRDVIELIRHPYLKTLAVPGGGMRTLLGQWENHIRNADKYLRPLGWTPDPEHLPEGMDMEAAAVSNLAQCTMTAFEGLETLDGLGKALITLCGLLIPADDAPENLWQRFPIDGECLFRLLKRVVPQLMGSSYSCEPYGRDVLFTVLRKLMEQERAPFEAEPLTGLQVLGWLETRLLKFEEVHVLDATDEKLPGASEYDPLLPDPLRGLLGLPDGRQRDYVAAYNFHRLIAGARRVRIYYRAGEEGPNPLSGRSIRSRFAEQLIWREEQKLKQIIETGDGGPVEPVILEPGPLPKGEPLTAKDDSMRERIKKMLTEYPVSPSLLDDYLRCQLRFFLERVAGLRPLEEVSEDVDHSELGLLVHEVLQRFFAPFLGREIVPARLDPRPLIADYLRSLQGRDFFRRMPLDQRLSVEKAGALRLGNYLENNTGPTTILALEREYRAILPTDFGDIALRGRLDRIDRRADGDHVLDYKTGSLPGNKADFLENPELLDSLRAWSPGDGPETIEALAEAAGSVQLPAYLYIYARAEGLEPADAAWIELRDKGAEKSLFGGKVSRERREAAVNEALPQVIFFIIRHMFTARHLAARPGKHCEWCPFKGGCPTPGA